MPSFYIFNGPKITASCS